VASPQSPLPVASVALWLSGARVSGKVAAGFPPENA